MWWLTFQGFKQQAAGAQEHSASTFHWKNNTKSKGTFLSLKQQDFGFNCKI